MFLVALRSAYLIANEIQHSLLNPNKYTDFFVSKNISTMNDIYSISTREDKKDIIGEMIKIRCS